MNFYKELIKGLWKENPVFRLVLGMCPTLAVTTTLENGLGMGVAATFVLVCSNIVISAVRNIIPSKVRIPCFIVIIATFVTVVDLLMNGFAHELHNKLGIFIPLIVVNCIILGRAEAFASKKSVWLSIADGIGMGIGFTLGLGVLGAVREIIGRGTITLWSTAERSVSLAIPGYVDQSLILLILPAGGFIALGCLLGLMNHVQSVMAKRRGQSFTSPAHLDCRHCVICKWGK
ncbi:electron transport complex subunit RsxE [Verrucomicrobiota bacterium]